MKPSDFAIARRDRPPFRAGLRWCLVLFLVILAAMVLVEKYPPWDGPTGAPSLQFAGLNRYFRMHQWSADAHTVLAMARYVLEPEGRVQTQSHSNRFSPFLVTTNRESTRGSA